MTDQEKTGSVFILLRPDGTILMQLRDENYRFPNTWGFPGGGKEEGEDYIDTAIREAYEEYEIKLEGIASELVAIYSMPGVFKDSRVFLFRISADQEPVMHEGAGMKWMRFQEIETLELGNAQRSFLPQLKAILDQPHGQQ